MTTEELNKIAETTNNATQGLWKSYIEGRDHESGSSFIMTGVDNERDYDIEFHSLREKDQDFIAMARNVIPDLLSEIWRLRKIIEDNSIIY
ncbi:MAG: hypothetical protein JST86_11625 [Bacteroidetes bacterium]|nr:hypothetical protein [Bacteroidota bacterium]